MLNKNQIKGKWTEIKGGIRNLWGKLTDDELEATKGDIESIGGLVRNKYGETQEEVKLKLEKLFDSFDNNVDRGEAQSESSYMRNPTSEKSPGEEWNARH